MVVLYKISTVTMAKPLFIINTNRTDCYSISCSSSSSSDLSFDYRSMSQRSSSARKGDLVFVVNPKGANGRTGKEWKKLLPYLRTHLGQHRNICECLTSAPSHAIDITREAIREGADAVVAVGGDGTLHEVVNGFFWAGKPVSADDDGNSHTTALGVVILQNFKWYDFIFRMHKLYNGTHLSVQNVSSRSVQSIEVEEITGSCSIYVQADGEHLGFLPRKFCILPCAIELIH
ncbi:hypothetical protein MKX01_042336 [Papaver californicum]|nr:hypothetical protein MKX01_042336 [Papaver californicum]